MIRDYFACFKSSLKLQSQGQASLILVYSGIYLRLSNLDLINYYPDYMVLSIATRRCTLRGTKRVGLDQILGKNLSCEGGEVLAQIVQGSCGHPISGGVQGQVGCSSRQPGLVESAQREVGTRRSSRSK